MDDGDELIDEGGSTGFCSSTESRGFVPDSLKGPKQQEFSIRQSLDLAVDYQLLAPEECLEAGPKYSHSR